MPKAERQAPIVWVQHRAWARFGAGLAAALLLGGWMVEWTFGQVARDAEAAHDWPTAPGVVTESRLELYRPEMTALPVVRYRFVVDGQTCQGSGVRLDVAALEAEDARAVVERYPVGREVRVLYDPERPWEASTLEQNELDFWDHLLLWPAAAMRWLGIVVALLAIRETRAYVRTRPEEPPRSAGRAA